MSKKIVIVGGGAAGLELATLLGKKLSKSSLAEITLVDQNLGYTWKPLWHEIAAGRVDITKDKTEYLSHAANHDFKFKFGSLTAIDRKNKEISLEFINSKKGDKTNSLKLAYDYLILAVGSVHNDFNTLGAKEFCLSFDTINQCKSFHNNLIIKLFSLAQTDISELHIAVIGGGSTGVELAFEIKNTVKKFFKQKDIVKSKLAINLNIIESSSTILNDLSDDIKHKTLHLLKKADIKTHVNQKVIKVDQDAIYTQSGNKIKADIKLWAAGIKAPDVLTNLDMKINKKNQLLIRSTLQLLEDENIFAIGDCANFEETKSSLPPTAQLARQQANFLAKSLTNLIKVNKALRHFEFKEQGTIISASSTIAIGEAKTDTIGKIKLNKKFAYLSYRFLYRRYQSTLYGWPRVLVLIIIDYLNKQVKPSVKLY